MSSSQIRRTCRQPTGHLCALRMFMETELWSRNVRIAVHPSVMCLRLGRVLNHLWTWLAPRSERCVQFCGAGRGGFSEWGRNWVHGISSLPYLCWGLNWNWRELACKSWWVALWKTSYVGSIQEQRAQRIAQTHGKKNISCSQPGSLAAACWLPRDWCPQEVEG